MCKASTVCMLEKNNIHTMLKSDSRGLQNGSDTCAFSSAVLFMSEEREQFSFLLTDNQWLLHY